MDTLTFRRWRALFLFALLFSGAASASVKVEYDKDTDFGQYQTFDWLRPTYLPDPQLQKQFEAAIERTLTSLGLKRAEGAPDLYVIVRAQSIEVRKRDVRPLGYSGNRWRAGSLHDWPRVRVRHIPTQKLRVDLLDRRSKERVWRGLAIDLLSTNPEKVAKRIDKRTERIFRRFPPKK